MRISKLFRALCALAFLAGSLGVRAQDNPAQAAARAALMNQMTAPPSPPANQTMAPAIVITPTGVSAVQPSPSAVQAPVSPIAPETAVVPAGVNDTPAQAAARAALVGRMADLNAQQSQPANPGLAPIAVAPSSTAAPMPAKTKPAPPVTAVPKATTTPVPASSSTAPAAVAPTPEKPVAAAVAPVVKPVPANSSYAGKSLGFPPVEAPPPPVSAQKQADLQALLAKYMANQVSPEEYQKERAAILAAP